MRKIKNNAMKLKSCILTILLINTTNIAEAGKTSFYNKLEKQNQRNLQKYNQKNKKPQKLDNEISTLLFLSGLYSYMQINKIINSVPKDQKTEEFINEFNNVLKDKLEKEAQETEMQDELNNN
jgi:hypothetical protein